jgi:hypothetical protein
MLLNGLSSGNGKYGKEATERFEVEVGSGLARSGTEMRKSQWVENACGQKNQEHLLMDG